MARQLRIQYAGALYHVMSRGNERRPIVRDDRDRLKRLEWLQRTVEIHGWQLRAFVLMTNHEHLFLTTPQPNLSAGMQLLNGSYTSYFNRRHRRVGHLFQGRFKALLVEETGYSLELSRYLHLNPLRAGIVTKPQQYPWSSYPGYHWRSQMRSWVTYGAVLREFGRGEAEARAAYRRFVRASIAESPAPPWKDAVEDLILGSELFVQRIRMKFCGKPANSPLPRRTELRDRPTLKDITEAVATEFRLDTVRWRAGSRDFDGSRAMAAYLARRCFGYAATEIAVADPSSVTHAVRRVEQASDSSLQARVKLLEGRIGTA